MAVASRPSSSTKTRSHLPGLGSSAFLSFFIACILLSGLQLYKEYFASSEILATAGGFLNAVLFLLLLTLIGNVEEALKVKTSWIEVGVALVLACCNAASIHAACVTTCFLFSCGILYELNKVSQA
mmetsp:Transcript_25457/g.42651  ORF Transcript_25457/g.42651 Transcript_25457/m.42651 type:complete len:126 (+) Transcript_25457:150-527(+)